MSSSKQNPVYQSDVTQTICGRSSDAKDGGYYEFQWHHGMGTRVTRNPSGTTGWATIIHSTNPACMPRTTCRIHLCAYSPCKADWTSKGKYGEMGGPKHLQPVQRQSQLSAVAEPSGSQLPLPALVQTAVAGSSSEALPPAAELAPVAPAPVVEQAPLEEPATALQHAEVLEQLVEADMVEVPDCPKEAALKNMIPPAPTSATHVDFQDAVPAVASTAVEAQHKIQATLLTLAREMRRPKAYVGYSAFILMGLLKKKRPHVWEGANYVDLIDVFAPWANEFCTVPVNVSGISCTPIARAGGGVELVPICDDYPLSQTRHFVAGIQVPADALLENSVSSSFQVLYASLGIAVIGSVLDGDCAFDVMTMMLGIPASLSARKEAYRTH